MKKLRLDVTTDTGGNGSTTSGMSGFGSLYAVQMIDGTFDDGVDITLTCEQGDLAIPLFTKADFNTDSIAYPRVLQQLATDGTNLTTHCEPICFGAIKATIVQGGATKSGSFILYIREL